MKRPSTAEPSDFPDDKPSPKRRKTMALPTNIAEIIDSADADAIILVHSLANIKDVGLRVSSTVLSLASPVLRSLVDSADHLTSSPRQLRMLEDNGDTLYLLANILHLRADKLPARLPAESLYSLAEVVKKYHCVHAVSRSTTGWFDWLYTSAKAGVMQLETWRMIEAAYNLDEPIYFARFTDMLVKEVSLAGTPILSTLKSEDAVMKKLAVELHNRRLTHMNTLRFDLDLLTDPCIATFSKAYRHYIDYAPGMEPDEDEEGDGKRKGCLCHVDIQAAELYLGDLRDHGIWPPTVWKGSIGAIVDSMADYKVPEYNDYDKCEFCDNLKGKFTSTVGLVKRMHRDRLWGLCLDCFKAGGKSDEDCRYTHRK